MPRTPDHRSRPDPDVLLARVDREARDATRGRLRIYFGASAGVGKTYAMLQAGRRLSADGRDVVVGIVETHGRSETAALLGADDAGPALETMPRTRVAHGDGDGLHDEFDLDAVLARRPELVLVDELAHSNVRGSRHPKRWQDVDELLAAGVDVFTTLNVQHLESLNDVVGGITGVRVWETVPDTFFDRADEVVLVDVSADELLERLSAGKVYRPEQAERASRHFFRKGNLIALREIALRRTADRVETDVQAYRESRAIDRVWTTDAALLCCIGPDDGAERVVRGAARLAGQVDVAWRAIYVETPKLQRLPPERRERILGVVQLAERLGAAAVVLAGDDVADTVARYAREHNLSRVVVGRASGARRFAWLRESIADRVAARAPEVDVVVVGDSGRPSPERGPDDATPARGSEAASDDLAIAKRRRARLRYGGATAAAIAVSAVSLPLDRWLNATNIAMLYLLAVALAALKLGRGPAAWAALVGVAAFDFLFVPPRYSFEVGDAQYLVTFGVMLTIALVVGSLAANLRYQARVAAHREQRARALYEFAREGSTMLRIEDVVRQATDTIGRLFDATVHVLLPRGDEGRETLVIDPSIAKSAGFEPTIAEWVFERGEPAGLGTDTLSGGQWLLLPLATPMRSRGVLAVRPARRRVLLIPEQRRLLETLAALVAIALERIHYVDTAQGAIVRIESEQLRNSILSALSHDLRTPIAVMSGIAETLARHPDGGERATLVAALGDEARRMASLVENLLEMARIETGRLEPRRDWHSIEETVGAALAAVGDRLRGHALELALPRDLPLVDFDAVLIERVLVNLLENAAKHSGAGSTVRIAADVQDSTWRLIVSDDGVGFPEPYRAPDRVGALFDKFTRGRKEASSGGVGLGLAICRSIVDAHGGDIRAESPPQGGARFVVTLPRRPPPPVPAEAAIDGEPVIADSIAR